MAGKSNPELESRIFANPDDPDAYLVYGDWLQSQDDPRGELIVVQHSLLAKPEFKRWKELGKTEAKLLETHAEYLLGPLAEHKELLKLGWHLGFIKSARAALGYDDAGKIMMGELVGSLLGSPSGRFLQELVVGMVDPESGDQSYQSVIDVLVEKKPVTLRSLHLGDFEPQEETEMSWSHIGDAGPLYAAAPKLQKLILQSGDMSLGKIVLPELREFAVRTGGLDRASIKAICGAKWPKLERLEVWFGSSDYGAEGTIEDIQPLLECEGLGKLKHLALKNAEFTDDICAALAKSKILAQLESVDLSMGCMTAEGVGSIASKKDAFKHLKLLVVEDNAIAEGHADELEGVAEEVRFGTQNEDRVADGLRYVSVGE